MDVEIVVGLSNLSPDGRPRVDDPGFDPMMSREAAEALIAEFRREGLPPPATARRPGGGESGPRAALRRSNVLLASLGLPTHAEPAEPPDWEPSVPATLPVEALYRLRRVMAHHLIWPGRPVEPLPDGAEARDDPALAQVDGRTDNHLIHHAEREGFYLPISFSQVVRDPGGTAAPGGWLGSSLRLAEELAEIAPLLDLDPGRSGEVPRATVNRVLRDRAATAPFHLEQWAWLLHAEAAAASARAGTAIVYA